MLFSSVPHLEEQYDEPLKPGGSIEVFMKDKQTVQSGSCSGDGDNKSTPRSSKGENRGPLTERASRAELYSRHDKVEPVSDNKR